MSVYDGFACMKSLLFILNVLFVVELAEISDKLRELFRPNWASSEISGIVVLLLGVCVNTYFSDYESFVDERYLYAPEFLIALGAIIVLIALLGCYGTITEDPCMTLMFSTFLILVFFVELAIGAAGYLMREKAESSLLQRFNSAMAGYRGDHEIIDAWDDIQANFNCCGIQEPDDWVRNNLTIPPSCCDFPEYGPLEDLPCADKDLHHTGCLKVFVDFVRMNAKYIQIIGSTLALMQLAGIMCSCYLSYGYRKGYEVI